MPCSAAGRRMTEVRRLPRQLASPVSNCGACKGLLLPFAAECTFIVLDRSLPDTPGTGSYGGGASLLLRVLSTTSSSSSSSAP